MLRRGRTFSTSWRKRKPDDKMLSHLLGTVEPVAPPEGLLRQIEKRVDHVDQPFHRMSNFPRLVPIFGVALASALTLAIAVLIEHPDRYLRDPSGRLIAKVKILETDAEIVALGPIDAGQHSKGWHLWGFPHGAEKPQLLGLIGEQEFFFSDFERFENFAMSMESIGFSSESPIGVVVPLVLEE